MGGGEGICGQFRNLVLEFLRASFEGFGKSVGELCARASVVGRWGGERTRASLCSTRETTQLDKYGNASCYNRLSCRESFPRLRVRNTPRNYPQLPPFSLVCCPSVSPLASAPTTSALGDVQSASKCDKLAPPSAAYMRTPRARMSSGREIESRGERGGGKQGGDAQLRERAYSTVAGTIFLMGRCENVVV